MLTFVSASNNCASWEDPVGRNENFTLWQSCNNCTSCNFTYYNPSDPNGVFYIGDTDNNWEFYKNMSGGNSTELGIHKYSYYCANALESTTGCVEFKVTSTGDYFDFSQAIVILGQIGAVFLFLVLGFTFRKEKWKIKTFFFIMSLVMGLILLNSINMVTGVSNGLYTMGQAGIIVMVSVIGLMIAWFFIMMTLELFSHFKKQKKDTWRFREYE